MNAWIIRPYPHYKYRMNEFLTGDMVAVGWPLLPNLASVSDEALVRLLDKHYGNDAAYKVATEKAKAINAAYECLSELVDRAGPLGQVPDPIANGARQHAPRPSSAPRHVYRERRFTPGFPDTAVFEMFVKSSNILSIGYSVPNHVLYIKFHGGAIYRYSDVPQSEFNSLLESDSKGRYARRNIYWNYSYSRC